MIIRRHIEQINAVRQSPNTVKAVVARGAVVVAQRFGVVNITRIGINVTFEAINSTETTIPQGAAVAMTTSGLVLATAATAGRFSEGVAIADVGAGQVGEVVKYGNLSKTNWTAVIGQTDLSINQEYYLSDEAGKLTTSPIGTVYSQKVGKAISTRKLLVYPQISIKV